MRVVLASPCAGSDSCEHRLSRMKVDDVVGAHDTPRAAGDGGIERASLAELVDDSPRLPKALSVKTRRRSDKRVGAVTSAALLRDQLKQRTLGTPNIERPKDVQHRFVNGCQRRA